MSIQFPKAWTTEKWYNGTRHVLEVDGHRAWIVEPDKPAGDGRWSWVTIWPESFVPRVGVCDLLEQGYYHVHVDALDTKATPGQGMPLLRHFHRICTDLGLAPKANLIGMSWGGFFALRFAAENPEKVACIYLDAPVCNMADTSTPHAEGRARELAQAYGVTQEQLLKHPLNPINNLKPIVDAKIPLFAATGEDDMIVSVQNNINVLEERINKMGGTITIVRRPSWGHHPHGFDDTTQLVDFMNDHAAGRR